MATVTVLLGLAIWALLRTGRRLVAIIGRRPYRILPTLERFEVITANRLANLLVRVVRLSQVVLIVLAVIVWVQINLAALPWTRPYARVGLSWLAAPVRMVWNSTVGFIPNFFYLLVIAAIAYGILRFSHLLSRLVGRGRIRLGGFDPSWAEPTYKLARVLIIAFALVAAFPYIPGSNSPAFRGISLFLGFFVTLASSSAISNIISGVILTYSGAFDIGERVRIAETTGDVISKTLLTTHVRTIKNVKVAIPNALVLGGHILNYSAMAAGHGLILHTSVTIGYDTPWRRVHELLIAAALASEGVAREPAPFVLQTALNDFHVSYELNAYTREAHQMAVTYSNLHKNIQDAFHRAGVEIMSPHYSALRDGNRSTIGDENLGPAYHQPAFRVEQVEPAADLDSPPALKLQDRS